MYQRPELTDKAVLRPILLSRGDPMQRRSHGHSAQPLSRIKTPRSLPRPLCPAAETRRPRVRCTISRCQTLRCLETLTGVTLRRRSLHINSAVHDRLTLSKCLLRIESRLPGRQSPSSMPLPHSLQNPYRACDGSRSLVQYPLRQPTRKAPVTQTLQNHRARLQ